jgi:DNA-binding MarR family transcriptional regulator
VADAELDAVTDAALLGLRAFVMLAERSLQAAGQPVTLTQYRTLAALAAGGPQSPGMLASRLGVGPSTVTRMCDRLVRSGLIRRRADRNDRRGVRIALTEAGRSVVDEVSRRRRVELAAVLRRLPRGQRAQLREALSAFAAAAGDGEEPSWPPGRFG